MDDLTSKGGKRTFGDLSSDDQQQYRTYQKERESLSDLSHRSICMCVSCGKGKRDMAYNKAYKAWYCTECFNMHREYAKEQFQTFGKTHPEGHEETAIHDLYETFLDYEESHLLEIKVITEGILIYLLKFPSSDKPPYTTRREIKKVLKRSDKAINYVLKSLTDRKLIDSISPSKKLKVKLTQAGTKEAQKTLDKVRGEGIAEMFPKEFPTNLEDFNIIFGYRSDMVEYLNPEFFEQLTTSARAEKTPEEEIKRRIDDHKEFYW